MDAFAVAFPFVLFTAGLLIYAPRAKSNRAKAVEAFAAEFEREALGLYDSFGTDDWDAESIHRARLTLLQLELRRREKTGRTFVEAVYETIARRGILTQQHVVTLQPFMLPRAYEPGSRSPYASALKPAAI